MNAAVSNESPAELSASIRKLLDDLGLAYRLHTERGGFAALRRVQAVLLEDAIGSMLVLLPQDHLLDLARLTELTAGSWWRSSPNAWRACSASTS